MRQAGPILRAAVLVSQYIFLAFYATVYALSPQTGHRMVGYLEEEAGEFLFFILCMFPLSLSDFPLLFLIAWLLCQ